MTVTNTFAKLCSNYRQSDETADVLASTVSSRLDKYDTAYYSSGVSLANSTNRGNLVDIGLKYNEIKGTTDKDALKTIWDAVKNDIKRFEGWFDKVNNAIRMADISDQYEDPSDSYTSPEDELALVRFVTCLCYASMHFFDTEEPRPRLKSFVQNLATRSYRIPRTARFLHGVLLCFKEDFKTFKEGNKHPFTQEVLKIITKGEA